MPPVASVDVRSKMVVLLLLIHYLLLLSFYVSFLFGPCFVMQYLVSFFFSFAIISLMKRELAA